MTTDRLSAMKEAREWLAANANLNMYNQHYRLIKLLHDSLAEAALQAAEQARWLPISEVPRNGDKVLIWVDSRPYVAYWGNIDSIHAEDYAFPDNALREKGWINYLGNFYNFGRKEPTHFQYITQPEENE